MRSDFSLEDTIIRLKVDGDVDSHIHRNVLVTEKTTTTTVTQRVYIVTLGPDLSNANPARGRKDVRRSMGHISKHPMTSETYRRPNKSLSSTYSFYCLCRRTKFILKISTSLKIVVVRVFYFLL